mmetsp:Transcript_48683/g.128782  ORF Transcript_48683/g.128782 Transcript_48683/m.128782 type:complete len:272 (-) Transcript_48683:52-867(-)
MAAWSLDKLLDSEDVPDYAEKQQDAAAIADVLDAPERVVVAPKRNVEKPQAPPADFNAGLNDAIMEATKGLTGVPAAAVPVPDTTAVKASDAKAEEDKVDEEGAAEVAAEAGAPAALAPLEKLARGELTPPASSVEGEAKLISSGVVDDAALDTPLKAAVATKSEQGENGMQDVGAAVEAASKALEQGSATPSPPASARGGTSQDDVDVKAAVSHFDSAMDAKVKQLLTKDVVEPSPSPARTLSTAEKLLAEDVGPGWLSPLQKLQQGHLP